MPTSKIITVSKQDKHSSFDLINAIEDEMNKAITEGYEVQFVQELILVNSSSVIAIYCIKRD